METALHLRVGRLVNGAVGIADEARGQDQRQVAALGFVEDTGGHASPDRVELQLGNLAFESQE